MGSNDLGDSEIQFDDVVKPSTPIQDGAFTEEELIHGISKLARNKAPGIDAIPAEVISIISEHSGLKLAMLDIINEVRATGVAPECWKTVVQVPIPKKGDLSQIANWRPICLVNSIVKLMNCMILQRIRPTIEPILRDSQYGFRPERSTSGAQILLNEVKTRACRDKSGLVVAFLDFAKAFPSVSFQAIKAALQAFHVGPAMLRTIMSIYRGLHGVVRTPYGNTTSFQITTGILQGDVLAPYLFILVVDRILHRALDGRPFGVLLRSQGTKSRGLQEVRLQDINYADDIALLASTKGEISRMIDLTAQESQRANLQIAIGKTKTAWMGFGRVPGGQKELRTAYLGKIPYVDKYRYLGQLQETGASSPVKDRLALTWAAFRRLKGIWNSPLDASTKLRLFDCLVYPVLTFGISSLPISNAMVRKTEVEINMMRRFACNHVKLDEFGHCYPLESLYRGTPRFNTIHRVSRAKVVGHMIRHSTVFRELLQWKSRENARQMSPSEECFHDLGITVEEALVFSQDRQHRQKLCDSLRLSLEPLVDYERITSSRWKSKYNHALKHESISELQFVEENSEIFLVREKEVHMYIDGSVRYIKATNECRGGAGIVIRRKWVNDDYASLRLDVDSAEQAEAESFKEALERIPEGSEVVLVHTDSFYVWNFFHHVRMRQRVVGYKKVANGELLEFLDRKIRILQSNNIEIYVCKVKAHNGNAYNDKADALALAASRKPLSSQLTKRMKTLSARDSQRRESKNLRLSVRPTRKTPANDGTIPIASNKRGYTTSAEERAPKKGSSLLPSTGTGSSKDRKSLQEAECVKEAREERKGSRELHKIVGRKVEDSPKRKLFSRKTKQ